MRKVRAGVDDPLIDDEELRQLEDARDELSNGSGESRVAFRDRRVGLAHHAHARGRRRDDSLRFREGLDEVTRETKRLVPVARVEVHLAAARLAHREADRMAEPFQDGDRRLPRIRKEGVVEAADEQVDLHVELVSGAPSWRAAHSATQSEDITRASRAGFVADPGRLPSGRDFPSRGIPAPYLPR